tara:strand:+ start:27623 stop:29911 length:2289 start_codon:yes stop_codon:yes gene_type:complete
VIDDRFRQLWQAAKRVHSTPVIADKIAVTAAEMHKLTLTEAVVVRTYLPEIPDRTMVRRAAPADAVINEGRKPAHIYAVRDASGVEFGCIEIFTQGDLPLTDNMLEVADMFGDSASFAIGHSLNFLPDNDDKLFRNIVDVVQQGIWIVSPDGTIIYANNALTSLLGYTAEESVGRSVLDFYPPEEAEISRKILDANLVGKLGSRELQMKRKDGSLIWVQVSGTQMLDEDGNTKLLIGVLVDLSDRKRIENSLRQNQAALETALDVNSSIIESAFDIVCVADSTGRFVSVSHRSQEVLGYMPDDLIGLPVRDFIPAEYDEERIKTVEELRAGKKKLEPLEFHFRAADGELVPVMASLSWNNTYQLVFIILRDLRAQKELEARLRQSQRLEAIGQLTGGVAHDFNNLLTVILGNAEALADRLDDDQSSRLLAEMTRTAAERGADLTSRLLAFARRQALDPQACDVNALVTRMDGLMRRMLDDDIEIEFLAGENLLHALVDAPQLESAILNIAVNARDAMPDGGRLKIETNNLYLDVAPPEMLGELEPGHYILLSMSDTGTGMSDEVKSRAFEPFFTTKQVGEGSGLGLSMVYGFVRQSGGHVVIDSKVGEGTSINIYLPVSEVLASEMADRPEAPAKRGQELILLVEDNDLVRSFVEGQLESLDYRVISAENGVKALEILRERPEIDMLFTDVVMPGGLNGRQLAEEARKLRSNLPILFTSGYSEDAIIEGGRIQEGIQLLAKPYRRKELADKIRLVLDAVEKT